MNEYSLAKVQRSNFKFMKTLKILTATMLLLVAMAAGAETISEVTIGNLVYSLDTDTKVATVTGYDRSNKPTDVVIPNTIKYGGGGELFCDDYWEVGFL